LLTAALRLLAMLVSSVASTLQMTRRRPAECHSDATPAALPREKADTKQQETTDRRNPARPSTHSVEADAAHYDDPVTIITSGRDLRSAFPAKAGIQQSPRSLS